MKILIALDESSHSQRALDFVTRVRWPAGSRLTVMSVVQPMTSAIAAAYEPAGALPPGLDEELRRNLQEVVSKAERTLRESGLSTEGRVVMGDPREAVVEAAREERSDLVVVGSHGRTGLAKLWLGSVSSHVVTHAPCSVLVVKANDERQARSTGGAS